MKDVKKRMSIVIIVGCILLAVLITVLNRSGSSSRNTKPIQLLCTNAKCGYAFVKTVEELSKLVPQGVPVAASTAFKCPKCGQESAYMAVKCKKCNNDFVINRSNPEAFDKCPKCGYSEFQEKSANGNK